MEPVRHRCVLIAMGGTIASRVDPRTGLAVPVCSGAELVAAIPEISTVADIEIEELSCIPSPHIGPPEWVQLHGRVAAALSRPDVTGVVISHGTALLEETAWFLDVAVGSDKPVVLVGAQRNASEADFDGRRNLLSAARVCVSPQARGMGVLVVLNQHVNAAREVIKTHSFDVETFNSGEWGYLANVTPEEVRFHRAPLRRVHVPLTAATLPVIEILSMYAGASGELIRAAGKIASGLVIQAVGAGHVNPAMYEAIRDVIRDGVTVAVSTRIPRGGARACYGFTGSSKSLEDCGAILSSDLNAWKARILLMLALQAGMGRQAIQELFNS